MSGFIETTANRTIFGKKGIFGSLLESPEVVKPEPPKPVPPIPTVSEEVSEQARKRRPRGRRETFLTGDLIPETTKKRRLG